MKIVRQIVLLCLFLAAVRAVQATVVYTYDFPGSPGSGLASAQTNAQPSGATFSDFTRAGSLSAGAGGLTVNAFSSSNWNQTGTIDTTQYVGYSITASSGFVLNLNSVSFLAATNSTGPSSARVSLFINGSATPYANFDYTPPNSSSSSFTFNFTPLTAADNVTSASIRFYAWNSGGPGGQLAFDNVATDGTIVAAVPEASAIGPLLCLLGAVVVFDKKRRAAGA